MNAVSVKNVSFSYENAKKPAVDNLSFDLEENSYTVLAGVNGSGKSTVSRIIAGLLEPASGSVSVRDGFRIGIVFQSPKDQIICSVVERDTAFGPKIRGFPKLKSNPFPVHLFLPSDFFHMPLEGLCRFLLGKRKNSPLQE